MAGKITVGVLCYGDYPQLARRCLGSLGRYLDWTLVQDVRIGLNQAGEATRAAAHACFKWPVPVIVYDCGPTNAYKYPLLRRMLFDEQDPVGSPYWMWLDDDSFLRGAMLPEATRLLDGGYQVIGRRYRLKEGLKGDQAKWIRAQPWYAGRPVETGDKVEFPQGAFWLTHTELLKRFDWPSRHLRHRGGDVMFGALIRQQQLRWHQDDLGVAINADEHGNHSKSPRRGFNEMPIGTHYDGKPPAAELQAFRCDKTKYGSQEPAVVEDYPQIIRLGR